MSSPLDTCFLCNWCSVSTATGPYSELTPGDEWTLSCGKGHFWVDGSDEHPPEKWHATITKSRDCADAERETS